MGWSVPSFRCVDKSHLEGDAIAPFLLEFDRSKGEIVSSL